MNNERDPADDRRVYPSGIPCFMTPAEQEAQRLAVEAMYSLNPPSSDTRTADERAASPSFQVKKRNRHQRPTVEIKVLK